MVIQFLFLASFVIVCHIASLFFKKILFTEPSPGALTTDIPEKEKSENMIIQFSGFLFIRIWLCNHHI